ncbi:sensor histidine kinase [Dactylosporangium darangshiense]|uniref:sensor histidine kinase n=1 Tax=Dactylosporangium darangshiense TaxID=579108 RepID=UPI0031EE43E4
MQRAIGWASRTGRAVVSSRPWPFAAAAVLALFAADLSSVPGLLLGLAMTIPLMWYRTVPALAAALIAAGVVVSLLAGRVPPAAGIAALAGAYLVVGLRSARAWMVILVVPFALLALFPVAVAPASGSSSGTVGAGQVPGSQADAREQPARGPGGDADTQPGADPGEQGRTFAVTLLLLTGGAVAFGAMSRSRAETARRTIDERRVADTLLDHAARGERARIARELHDVVAHHVSMIAVQAEAARLTTPGLPPDGGKRLLAIGDTARTALTEMRRLLGVLREDAGTPPARRPQPGLRQLNELIDEARALGGASTRLIVRGAVAPLDPGVELTVYRIVQEALTNARRHAPGAAVDVELDYGPSELRVRVRDNGPGAARGPDVPGEQGHGLTGMRERAAMLGGSVEARPGSVGGFLIEARLPILAGDRAEAQ